MSFRCRVAASLLVLVVAGCGPSTSSAASGATVDQSSGRGASGRPAAGENAGSTGVGLPTATSAAGVTATSVPAAPSDFYDIPQPLPPGPAGSIVWAQRVAAPVGAVAWRVLYHSTSVSGGDVAVSGLVVAPDSPPRIGGFPVLAYAHGSTGLADACAPSKDARAIEPTATGSSSIGDLPVPSELWTPGYVVAATDYEGLGTPGRHPYLVGASEARSVLDAVRAARSIPDAHASDRTVVIGASQGGHAALFSGELAPAYAPDIGLSGVVALAPAAELGQAARLLASDDAAVGFAVAIGAGFAAAYPEAKLQDVMTSAAWKRIGIVDRECIGAVVESFAGPAAKTLRLERLLAPPWRVLLDENTPGRVRTAAPIFVGQGEADPLVIPALTDALVARLCAQGDEVMYRRYPATNHEGIATAAASDVMAWIAARFAGTPGTAAGSCPD